MKQLAAIGLCLSSWLAGIAPAYATDHDTLLYRLHHTIAGSHPYIQKLVHDQLILRNQASQRLQRCLLRIDDKAPIHADLVLYVNYDRGWHAMQKVANCYGEERGTRIRVEISPAGENLASNFEQRMATGNGPDIILWAHDRVGDWAKRGYLQQINPHILLKHSIPLPTWEAGKYQGKYYGYPIAMESSALIYNKELLPSVPSSIEAFATLGLPSGIRPLEWDYKNTYFTQGLLAAGGGYAFKQNSSGWDAKDTGVNNGGSVVGLQTITNLINSGGLSPQADYGSAMDGMLTGQVAAIINGPWAWKTLQEAGVNFGVAPLPSVAGQPGKPFVGVLTYLITSQSHYPADAKRFLENYLLTEQAIALVDEEWALGGVLNISYVLNDARNPLILDSLQASLAGQLMPNIPEMSKFWSAMPAAIISATNGSNSAKVALDQAASQIQAAE